MTNAPALPGPQDQIQLGEGDLFFIFVHRSGGGILGSVPLTLTGPSTLLSLSILSIWQAACNLPVAGWLAG